MPESTGDYFLVQWHVTNKCDQKCRHCYVYENNTDVEKEQGDLLYDDCVKILNDIYNTVTDSFKRKLHINFSGGDPLLRSDFFQLLTETRNKGIKVGILGNPHHVTRDVAKKLYQLGVSFYQVSLDGLEDTHDMLRMRGSFNKTLNGIRTLQEAGVRAVVMFTLSRTNMHDLLNVATLCHELGVDSFAFDSIVPIGNAREMDSCLLSQDELKRIMLEYMQHTNEFIVGGSKTAFRRKSNLWTLLESEVGLETKLVQLSRKNSKIIAGCTIGISSISVLSDGTVYPCRRLPRKVGKFPEQSLEEVFFGKAMNVLRQEHKIAECNVCEFFTVCRGCRALAYAVNNDYFSKDPHCWKSKG